MKSETPRTCQCEISEADTTWGFHSRCTSETKKGTFLPIGKELQAIKIAKAFLCETVGFKRVMEGREAAVGCFGSA